MTEPTGAEWLDQTVRITRDAVYFGEHKLPGLIAQDGITLKTGGNDDFNRITVEFFVGPVTADDPCVTDTPTDGGVQYSSRQPVEPPLLCASLRPRKHLLSTSHLCEKERNHSGPHCHGETTWVDA